MLKGVISKPICIGIIWKLVGNADFLVPSRTYWISNCIFTKFLDNSYIQLLLHLHSLAKLEVSQVSFPDFANKSNGFVLIQFENNEHFFSIFQMLHGTCLYVKYILIVYLKFKFTGLSNLAIKFRRIGPMSNITLDSPTIVQCLPQLLNVCLGNRQWASWGQRFLWILLIVVYSQGLTWYPAHNKGPINIS